jgi:uncharacterized small protein (DUF1192 family)
MKRLVLLALACGAGACSSTSSGTDAGLHWYTTCGAPVCQTAGGDASAGASIDGGVAACTSEKTGDPCASTGTTCDPGLGCDVLLICAAKDPKVQPGGCPISRRAAKRDIAYLDEAAKLRLVDEVRRLHLARYRYKDAPLKDRLGFIIDDDPSSSAVDGSRDQIDLYSYLSMAVAALQQEIARGDAQDRKIAELCRRLDAATKPAASASLHGHGEEVAHDRHGGGIRHARQ